MAEIRDAQGNIHKNNVQNNNSKRTFDAIRKLILINLFSGKKTINQISTETKVNWRTVELHLNYLVGRKMVAEVFSSKYVRIFEITDEGARYSRMIIRNRQAMGNRQGENKQEYSRLGKVTEKKEASFRININDKVIKLK